jgi:S-formylglutathione hydrolase
MNTSIRVESRNRCFGGEQLVVSHESSTLDCAMRFAVFVPSCASNTPVPTLYYLSGLTCTEQNVITKAGAQRYADGYGVAFVCPDTSPRGPGVADDEATDLGMGAGFYVNATETPWASHYRMYDYIVKELPAVVEANFPVTNVKGLTGHSMGGHGALVIGLREPDVFRSVSAFSPIASPSRVPWGQKALRAYLGPVETAWHDYDAVELLRRWATGRRGTSAPPPFLVDVGTDDPFLQTQLRPDLLEQVAAEVGYPLTLRRREGYDHSYYFIQSFIADHIAYHSRLLGGFTPR